MLMKKVNKNTRNKLKQYLSKQDKEEEPIDYISKHESYHNQTI